VTLRTALPDEIPTLEALQRHSSLVWADTREQLLAHADAIAIPVEQVERGWARVALGGDGVVIGFSLIVPPAVTDGAAELDGLFVEPDHMRGGVGRVLVADAVERARARSYPRIEVMANPNARGFYERVGFTGGETVDTRFGPGLRMGLDLHRG